MRNAVEAERLRMAPGHVAVLSFPVREVGHQGLTGNCPRVFLILSAGRHGREFLNRSNKVEHGSAHRQVSTLVGAHLFTGRPTGTIALEIIGPAESAPAA